MVSTYRKQDSLVDGSAARVRPAGQELHVHRETIPHAHRQYRLTADHLVGHFDRWPADELAGLMLGAFSACGDAVYRAHGDALMEQQAALGPESWPWMSWLASTRAEQGRVREAHELAGQALALHPVTAARAAAVTASAGPR